ncbi:hypothetical protein B296_00023808 [Ensete ventricosum]|uniref:non-specific serine/threonine protein kinase n=1 Tax=Ensete ventricosum TaxID=4639 RepID=A0A426ZG08_ENSVE|nr:hypothetical protein B296_00023808 [Ensete ventricosum]
MASKCFYLNLFVVFFVSFDVSFSFEPLNMEGVCLFLDLLFPSFACVFPWIDLLACSPVEALIAIRSELHDPHKVLSNWDEDSVDPCSWAMITCSSENHVIGLLLQNNNISGELPPELGLLPKLQSLDLSNNRFNGSGLVLQQSQRPCVPNQNFQLEFAVPCVSERSKAKKLAIAMGASVGGSSLLLLLALFLFLCRRKRQKNQWRLGLSEREEEEAVVGGLGNLRRFTLRELRVATENFSSRNVLGKGGFGHVYRGRLSDGTVVAVKRLRADAVGSGDGEAQFRTEVEMISLAIHRNLLRLLGYCAAAGERLLVYPFMPNGSVAARLRGTLLPVPCLLSIRLREPQHRSSPIAASTREQIWPSITSQSRVGESRVRLVPFAEVAVVHRPFDRGRSYARISICNQREDVRYDACFVIVCHRGLLYLHEQCDPKIIHRDVKAANVLLDGCCEAVVGDFGLAKLLDHGDSHVTTAVRGTVGHIAPEYLSTGQSSDKTDVFGFGVLLLELVSGRRVVEFGKGPNQNQKCAMLDWVCRHHLLMALGVLRHLCYVALLCTQNLPSHRPKMSEVVRMLEGDGLADKWEASNRPFSASISLVWEEEFCTSHPFLLKQIEMVVSRVEDTRDWPEHFLLLAFLVRPACIIACSVKQNVSDRKSIGMF